MRRTGDEGRAIAGASSVVKKDKSKWARKAAADFVEGFKQAAMSPLDLLGRASKRSTLSAKLLSHADNPAIANAAGVRARSLGMRAAKGTISDLERSRVIPTRNASMQPHVPPAARDMPRPVAPGAARPKLIGGAPVTAPAGVL